MEALQNPMALGSSSESILEESTDQSTSPTHRDRVGMPSNGPDLHNPREPLSRRQGGRGWLSGEDRPSTPLLYLQRGLRGGDRRSKSLERTNKSAQVKGHRERSSSGGSGSISPKKLMNGYALRFGRLDVEAAFHRSDRRGSKEEPGYFPEFGTDPPLTLHVPGNQDRGGRAVLQVCTRAQVWGAESCRASDVICCNMGLVSMWESTEMRMLIPNALYIVLLLVDKETAAKPERDFAVQTEVFSSLKTLQKYIDQTQLTRDLDGSFAYDHNHWISFRQKIEPFVSSCNAAISSLQQSISMLGNNSSLKTSKEVSEVMDRQKQLMKCVLDDARLNRLRLEGGTVLARIKKEECSKFDSMLNTLYNQVDEEVHKLVILSNKAQKQLESVLDVCKFEEQTNQVSCCQLGLQLVKEAPQLLPGSVLIDFKQHLGFILNRVERRKNQLDILTNLYEFYDSVRTFQTDKFTYNSCNRRLLLPPPLPCDDKSHSVEPFSSPAISVSAHFNFPDSERKLSTSMFDDTDSDCTFDSISCHSEPVYSAKSRPHKQPMKKMMKKTLSFELTPRDNGHSDASHVHGYTGVYIKGLEVANNVSAEKKLQRPDVASPALGRSRSMSTPTRLHTTEGDDKKQSGKVQHIMDEMISTEREYVRSLSYIIEHYFPEMERIDLPQDLRGKRSIIFGNVEKLWDFHSQYFLKELESCAHSPLSISSCFLRHEDQFGMYALYSKNKPQSDALLCSHGNEFFKNKQMELGDKMDLASYLLKPIQRMSKYALLLKDLIKECSQSQEQELSDLRTAEEMVKFQLRHGNDLLAMDAIRGCDVNLKEQGQLRCQDEFIVWCGRRKYLRHVFLFEDLILFSKTKKIEGGYDIYIYKQSYKTAEIGMTENVGDSGLRFEIWFRRRKSQDTFILQASSAEVKAVWTAIIGKILWRQALRNRELRMQEMVSMGIGSKPFMDIKPSDAAISDRAIDYIMKGSESRTRASIAVPLFEYSSSVKRPHSTISNSSTSSSSSHSSSSLLGPLNLHMYTSPSHPHTHPMSNVSPFGQWPYDCIEEDELEQDTGSHSQLYVTFTYFIILSRVNAATQKKCT
uniref:Uncharacterized protein n=1 Tax=Periophthalmus magnuspinnatus TaxID=409849 RepID=A0A3B4ADW5_9GOBI